jgi:hypothetical protein
MRCASGAYPRRRLMLSNRYVSLGLRLSTFRAAAEWRLARTRDALSSPSWPGHAPYDQDKPSYGSESLLLGPDPSICRAPGILNNSALCMLMEILGLDPAACTHLERNRPWMSGPSRSIVSQQDFFGEDAEPQRTQSGKNSGRFVRAGRHSVRNAILAFSASSAPLRPPQKILAYLVMDRGGCHHHDVPAAVQGPERIQMCASCRVEPEDNAGEQNPLPGTLILMRMGQPPA